jgi:NDP-sugar pyrophosphorylase family protein
MSSLADRLQDSFPERFESSPNPATSRAIVLAGGRGTRLAPYTSILPKPLMPIGERAILEIVVDQLGSTGFTDVVFSVGYLSHLIRAVFSDHANRDVEITYVHEEQALGTAGPLRLIDDLDETFVAMNGDVLTTLNYRDLVRHHCEADNILTIATHDRTVKIDYGVLHVSARDSRVHRFQEKPEIVTTVSMGVYVFEPRALDFIPPDVHFDFPELVQALLDAGEPVGAYPFKGMWFDIGRHDDYEEASRIWTQEIERPRRLTAMP